MSDATTTVFWRAAAVLMILTAATQSSEAQELAGSFDQLRVLVKVGDRVRITDTAGREMSGTIADLGSSSLVILGGGGRRDLRENEINTISQRRPDPLANGAKWGFAIGAGLGLLAGVGIASGDGNSGVLIPILSLGYGGIGAGIGVGMDAMFSSEQVIYAGRTNAAARITMTPVLRRDRRAVLVSLGL